MWVQMKEAETGCGNDYYEVGWVWAHDARVMRVIRRTHTMEQMERLTAEEKRKAEGAPQAFAETVTLLATHQNRCQAL